MAELSHRRQKARLNRLIRTKTANGSWRPVRRERTQDEWVALFNEIHRTQQDAAGSLAERRLQDEDEQRRLSSITGQERHDVEQQLERIATRDRLAAEASWDEQPRWLRGRRRRRG